MIRDPAPDLWDDVPYSPEGQRIHDERANVRAQVEALDKRVATVIAKAALTGWVANITGPGPELTFYRWGRSVTKLLHEAEAFVETLPRVKP